MKTWLRLLIAVALLAAVIGVLYWPKKPAPAAAAPLVAVDASQVQRIAVTRPGHPDTVLTRSGASWNLDQPYAYPADGPTVASLLDALGGITGAKDVGASNNPAAFGLDKPSTVELGLANGKALDFEFGADTPTGGNSYLRLGGAGAIQIVPSDVKQSALKSAFLLQDKTVLHFPSGQLTALDVTDHGKALHLDCVKGAWPKAQQANVQSLLDALQDGQMTTMPDPDGKDAAADGLGHPPITLRLTWNGGSAELDLGNKNGSDEYYARNNASPAIFTLSDYLATDITNLTAPPKPLSVSK